MKNQKKDKRHLVSGKKIKLTSEVDHDETKEENQGETVDQGETKIIEDDTAAQAK